MEQTHFHLWLMPDGHSQKKLKTITDALSQRFNAPEIEPHLSLLLHLEGEEKSILEKTQQLAQHLSAFEVSFETIDFREKITQAFFWKAKLNDALQHARSLAEQVFQKPPELFMPHISLLYGELDLATKEKLKAEWESRMPRTVRLSSISVLKDTNEYLKWATVQSFALK